MFGISDIVRYNTVQKGTYRDFQTKRFLWEFPIGSYVKLSSAENAGHNFGRGPPKNHFRFFDPLDISSWT